MVVLQSIDWALFWGNPNIWPISRSAFSSPSWNAPSKNVMDFQVYKTAMSSLGLSNESCCST